MVRLISSLLLVSLASLAVSKTMAPAPTCNNSKQCPEEKPCCSQYGECGTGAFCLGGCDPFASFTLDSCLPEPVCQDKTYKWENLDNAALNTKYVGNATKYDWVYSGFPKVEDGNLIMTMPKETVGTLFANNHYIWYGKISGKIKSSRGQGVVTAFILLSDTKDEIDFEFVGSDLGKVQTNYYFKGILDYENGDSSDIDGDTFEDWHTYEIDWTPDSITWTVDGDVKRTLEKESTWNETAQRFQFPQTPSRMQMSLWPAGQASSPEGTRDWAGGEIDWDSQDIKDKGYYDAQFGEITVECYQPPEGADITGGKSYIFKDDKGLNTSVKTTDNDTVIASFAATGLDPERELNKTMFLNSTHTSSNSSSNSSITGPSRTGSPGGNHSPSKGVDNTTSNGASSQSEQLMQGSFFAVLVALVVLITM